MDDKIKGLAKSYVIWPELKNDFQKNINFSNMTMAEFTKEINTLPTKRKSIDTQIAVFYLANERLSKARINSQDVLGEKELADYQFYQKTINKLSKELLAYITVCSLVEARHNSAFSHLNFFWSDYVSDNNGKYSDLAGLSPNEKLKTIKAHDLGENFINNHFSLYKEYFNTDEKFDKFLTFFFEIETTLKSSFKVKGGRSKGYRNIAENYLQTHLQNYTLGEVLDYLNTIFYVNPFKYGFGGPAWGAIAKHGASFVNGKINAEMFVDQAFSLEHNNGNMFNKDYLFSTPSRFYINTGFHKNSKYVNYYLNVNANDLILNAQHLGMVSGLLNIGNKYNSFKKIPKDDIINNFKATHPHIEMDASQLNRQYELINDAYVSLNRELRKVKQEIKESYPDLLKEGKNNINLQELFTEIAVRQDSDFKDALQEKSKSKTYNNEKLEIFIFDLWDYINKGNSLKLPKATKAKSKFLTYDVSSLPRKVFSKNIVGGKAWGLANMNALGLPVPKAQVFTTDCCTMYYQDIDKFNEELEKTLPQLDNYLNNEKGDPILVSVRSGAPISMPGMMDTVLNVGIDDSNYDYFCKKMGKKVVDDCATKFMELFCSSNLGVKLNVGNNLTTTLANFRAVLEPSEIDYYLNTKFPLNKIDQVRYSLEAVFKSWHSERAIAYRNEKNIDHNMGTAAIVQQMVFGNLNENSCTGVVFSRDCLTGEDKLVGEFLPKAQGEDVVSGSVTPFSISELKQFNKNAYNELYDIAKKLEKQTGQIQDIEFTVEDGKLYILQHRQAVCSPIAAVKILEDSTLDHTDLIKQIEPKTLQETVSVMTEEKFYANGLSANSGVLTGLVIKDEYDMITYKSKFEEGIAKNPNFGWIFYSELTSPEHMPIMNKTHGFITEQGGFTSHAAIIARSLNKPCIVGIGNNTYFNSGETITMDGTNGKIWKGEQQVVVNNDLAKSAANYLIKLNDIKVESLNEEQLNESLNEINNKNSLWVFNCDKAHYVETKAIKKEKFLDLGQKIAMLLAANNRNTKKLSIA
jgi:pyruvate, orthophosphate dikinase